MVPFVGTCLLRIISKRKIRDFQATHPRAQDALKHWANIVEESDWLNPGELRASICTVDFVDGLSVFDVGGNKYRVITFGSYRRQILYIKQILTHVEYSTGSWKP